MNEQPSPLGTEQPSTNPNTPPLISIQTTPVASFGTYSDGLQIPPKHSGLKVALFISGILAFIGILVALGFVFSVSFSLSSQALEMVEGKYEVIDTGVQNTELFGPHTVGFWLNNHKLLINTFSDEKDAQLKKLGKVILFDTQRKQSTTIFETGNIFCGNAPSKIFRVRDYTTGTDTYFKIDESGKTSQVEAPSGWEPYQCRVYENRKKDRLQAYLNESEGYIDQGKTGNGGREKAILHLTGKPQIELPLTGHDIDYMVYLPFKNQYLLNNFDFISGRLQPSGEPFYNYMSPDGTLTRVPQPEEFLKFAGQLGDMYPMRDGMIIDNTGYMRKNPGLYY